jgi:hypothetical protein
VPRRDPANLSHSPWSGHPWPLEVDLAHQLTLDHDTTRARVRRSAWWFEVLVIAWLYWLYDAINNLSPTRQAEATRHATDLLAFEQHLFLDIELGLNRWLSHHDVLGKLLSDYYNIAHLALTLIVLAWLWWRHPGPYVALRNAIALMNVVGFAVFWLYPLAPPRMLDGYIDTVSSTHAFGSWHSGTLGSKANEFAAMPSLHVSWALWCSVAIWLATARSPRRSTWRGLAVAHSVITVIAVIATANHFSLDVVGGAATAALAFWVASLIGAKPRRYGVIVASDDGSKLAPTAKRST